MTQPVYNTGAVGYDEFFGQVTRLYIPALLEAGRLRDGQTVLDVATGTGIAAEAALAVVGPSGSVIGGDVSLNMLDVARKRLANQRSGICTLARGAQASSSRGRSARPACTHW